uniref:Polyphenol oxidase C-terminal domain-containing protein n=1 Tax=Aegilops tauschii subsp. strangulata TaxID=200361 RepID=A0A453AAZ2_AEGTS
SGAPMKKIIAIAGMMMATLFIAGAQQEAGGCIVETSDVPGASNPCICSQNCACAGKCILNAGEGADDVQTCFVECVLKNGCGDCPGPWTRPLPTTLYKTLRLKLTRPKASETPPERETLRVFFDVEPRGTDTPVIEVYLNMPEGKELSDKSEHHLHTFLARPDHKAEIWDIRGALLQIGAGSDKTVEVSFLPKAWGERVTITSVKIE